MLFTYTYRDNSGAVRRDCVEAGSRAEAVSLLRSRNIFPLSLKEGPKGRNAADVSGSVGRAAARPFNRWLVICAVLGTVLAGGGLWWSMQTVPTTVQTEKRASPKNIKKTTDAKHSPPPKAKEPKSYKNADAVITSSTSSVLIPELPAVGIATNTPILPSIPPTTFNNASDQVLAMITSDDGTGSVPPIPISRDIEKEFLKSLEQQIVILETGDEKTRQIKEAVIAARAEMKRLVDSGMTVSQVIAEHQKLASENADVRNKAMLELNKIIKSGDIKGAEEYKRKINIALQQMGISELSIPVTEEEKEERAITRRKRMLKKRERQAAAPKK